MSDRPVHRISIGNIYASIWQNVGKGRTYYTVTFQRSYQREGDYHYADSFTGDQLLRLAKLADKAHSWTVAQQAPSADDPQQDASFLEA